MNDHEIDRRLARVERELRTLAEATAKLIRLTESLQQRLNRFLCRPAPGTLTATFTLSGDSMNALLVATLPTSRQDGSTLNSTDIASITFQKTTALDPVTEVPLATNTAATPGAGLSIDQITYTDTSSTTGDSYTFFVTDSAGNVGAVSNAVVNTSSGGGTPPVTSPPAAGTLAATFS